MAVAKDSSRDTGEQEEEGIDDDATDGNTPTAPDAPYSSSTTTAATIPSDTMDIMTYDIVSDDATVDSTVVDEEREVVADSSSYDDGKGIEEEKQKGDPES
jgi:hypothetical protein